MTPLKQYQEDTRYQRKAPNIRHGLSESPEYMIWLGMNTRCSNHNEPGYDRYGGRGISVCEEWQYSFIAFYQYLKDTIGLRKSSQYSIDRIDNDGNYEPGNLRWATRTEQSRNRDKRRIYRKEEKQSLLPKIVVSRDSKTIGVFNMQCEVIREFNLRSSEVSECLNGKQKTTKGYSIKYEQS